jgi:hypothetical protein
MTGMLMIARSMPAIAAGVALFLQIVFGPALAMRMLAGADPATFCLTAEATHDRSHPAPVFPHDHDDCLICHGHPLAIGLLPVLAVVLVALSVESRPWSAATATPAPARPFRHYSSRAPPIWT